MNRKLMVDCETLDIGERPVLLSIGAVVFDDTEIHKYFHVQIDIESAKAQAVPEQDQQVWATSNLTWKDIAFRALTCKVLKSTENWVHVKNIACVGSTTASLICKKLGVDPDGTKFELIEAQEPAND